MTGARTVEAHLIHDLDTLSRVVTERSRVLCLYSGGLDGTYLLHWLSRPGCGEVTALTVDMGGDELDRRTVERLCDQFGARSLILDRREEFARDFVVPAIAAQATYLGAHPISASLSRPLISKVAVEVARQRGCDVILHTSNHSQNSLRRFNGALSQLGFDGAYGSPLERSPMSREARRDELGVAAGAFAKRAHSSDSNLWCREFEYGTLDDPEHLEVPEFLYRWTSRSAESTEPASLSLEFLEGVPVAMHGKPVEVVQLVGELNRLAGRYGLGRYVGLEEIEGGAKVQEVREMPAACVLLDAYRRLESCTLSAECIREKMHVEQLWVREAVEGRWYGPLRAAAQAFVRSLARRVTGSVSYELSPRSLQVTGLKADRPLYVRDRLEYENELATTASPALKPA